MKTIKLILILGVLVFNNTIASACKDPLYTENYPVEICKEYDYILVVKIDTSKHSESIIYNPLFTFEGTIMQSLKGKLGVGDTINGTHKKEVTRAVCPVHLEQGGVYLLLLSKDNDGFLVSRFSFPVKSDNQYFDQYVDQIKAVMTKD